MIHTDKKILITGATHGIGLAVCKLFLKNNWEVFGCASNTNDKRGLQMQEQTQSFNFMYADIACENDVEKLLLWTGTLNAAFNNAGIGVKPSPIHLMDTSAAARILAVNLMGTALCMKHEAAIMLKNNGGIIVNCSSIAAFKAGTGADPIYSASKAGILSLSSEAAASISYRDKIKFFTIIPGWIETRMTATDDKKKLAAKLPDGRIGNPNYVAETVHTIITNSDAFNSGQQFQINGGGFLI